MKKMTPLELLKYHVSGAIERGEAGIPEPLHAPAPWTIRRLSKWHDGTPQEFDLLEVVSRQGYQLAITHDCKPEAVATANLICAAPDLLTALGRLLKISQEQLDQAATHDGLVNCEALANARAAIAKALNT